MASLSCTLQETVRRERLQRLRQELFSRARAVSALENGYSIEFPECSQMERLLKEFQMVESRCCPFLSIRVRPAQGSITLELTGPPGSASIVASWFLSELP